MRVARVIRNTETDQVSVLSMTSQTFPTFEEFRRHVTDNPDVFAGDEWTLVAERPILSVQPYDGYNIEVVDPDQSSQQGQPAEGPAGN